MKEFTFAAIVFTTMTPLTAAFPPTPIIAIIAENDSADFASSVISFAFIFTSLEDKSGCVPEMLALTVLLKLLLYTIPPTDALPAILTARFMLSTSSFACALTLTLPSVDTEEFLMEAVVVSFAVFVLIEPLTDTLPAPPPTAIIVL
ncbi:unknown [Clostridium sp. CAG:306]|nr:unknown [Clostridium sp. CAG:306]